MDVMKFFTVSNTSMCCALALSANVYANEDAKGYSIVPYIINGNEADVAAFPYMGLLIKDYLDTTTTEYPNGYLVTLCGSTVLDERHVLTAAHCVEAITDAQKEENKRLAVVFKVQNINSDIFANTKYSVESIYYHDDYNINNNLSQDIAILKLSEPISSDDVSRNSYVAIAGSESDYRSNDFQFTLIGYGNTGPETSNPNENNSKVLQKTKVSYITADECQKNYPDVDDAQICVTGSIANMLRTGACQGDSGVPLLYRRNNTTYQAGLVSFGPESCGDTSQVVQSVYTELVDYQGWISSVLNGTATPKQAMNETDDDSNNESSNSSSGGGSLGGFGLALLGLIYWNRRRR
ncbi:serine protease [Vibrio sp. S11_S32]|uniref:S1 family peptidase n=1 Tax=Vibrio sp. S11_S32 TaxID=2720225 RepID=UPI0016812592|nr:serine protease [Vibrio sp. S11_S32]MBD1577948.1 serine protease [Vibrio sp. S11_S32]